MQKQDPKALQGGSEVERVEQYAVRAIVRGFGCWCKRNGVARNDSNMVRYLVRMGSVPRSEVMRVGIRQMFDERYDPKTDRRGQVMAEIEVETGYSLRSIQYAVNGKP